MNISEAVKITGLTAATLRYYESEGLIPPVNRKMVESVITKRRSWLDRFH